MTYDHEALLSPKHFFIRHQWMIKINIENLVSYLLLNYIKLLFKLNTYHICVKVKIRKEVFDEKN